MTPDRWGYKLMGFPEFGTDFHLVGSLVDAVTVVANFGDMPTLPVVAHEDEFL
ncbi:MULTISPECIES: hypothetical protein [unclassified Rhodococcus (in: high G+C Gram-positive bacteria)]|uniref:hypothetical protein n=1 Tax=unclassified Rhodococcus (in: high G+C Gram-positive bacteria) TaxID=192944 RepID=UPI0015C66E60|nr:MULTISPECIES: hypothetical protein [unclassified Rhodococcus (in: high G+C Gram-positive bacteria)]